MDVDTIATSKSQFADAVRETFRNEEWKYTNLAPLLNLYSTFTTDIAEANSLSSEQPEHSPNRILVVNGIVKTIVPYASVVATANTREAVKGTATDSPFVKYLNSHAPSVVEIQIPDGVHVPSPIVVDIVTDGTLVSVVNATSIRLIVGKDATVVLKEQHHAIGNEQSISVSATDIVAKSGSTVHYIKHTQLPDTLRHIGATTADVHAGAKVHTHTMCLGGPYVRNDVYIRLLESSAEAYLNGLSVLHDHEVADNHTAVDHMVPHCHSEELYKGIYHDASTGIFNGKIYVRPDAQKTTAYQSSRSLLLGDRAQVNAKPQLEIWADDVKCSHGATTGQLDTEALFYLRSRGLSLTKAKELLVEAFAQEMYDRLP